MKLSDLEVISEHVDIEKYLDFTNFIKKDMADPNWLGDFDKNAIDSILKNGGKIWLYYENDTPVCSMMLMTLDKDTLKRFGLEYLPYKSCVDYGPMMVAPNYRGRHLQRQMFDVMNSYALEKEYKYAICTIHPDNLYSKNNAEASGFVSKNIKEFKRGKRIIYLKEFDNK